MSDPYTSETRLCDLMAERDAARRELVGLRTAARQVMDALERHGPGIVPHLLDTDNNAGQRLRDLLGNIDAASPAVRGDAGPLLTAISSWLDASYHGLSGEAHLVRRCVKAGAEYGEMLNALYGYLGENPRKGVTHSRDDLRRELLDVAVAALGAVEHVDGNRGTALPRLERHVRAVAERAVPYGLQMPTSVEAGPRGSAVCAECLATIKEDYRGEVPGQLTAERLARAMIAASHAEVANEVEAEIGPLDGPDVCDGPEPCGGCAWCVYAMRTCHDHDETVQRGWHNRAEAVLRKLTSEESTP